MKVMAVGTLKPLSQEQRQQYLPKEVPATLQLYLDSKMVLTFDLMPIGPLLPLGMLMGTR